jgi:sugar phosphate isomerase/epimerase
MHMSMPVSRALSLSYYTVPELSAPEVVDVAADMGCQHVGLRLLNGAPSDPATPLMSDPAFRRLTLKRLRDRQLTALDASAARLRPDTQVRDFGPVLEIAAEMGVRHVLASGDDPEGDRLVENFARLCEMACQYGLRIEVEFVPWLTIASLRDAAHLIATVKRGNFGIAVDALHFDRSHSRLSELSSISPAHLRYAQICDAMPCTDYGRDDQIRIATQERLFPGDGALDLVGLLHALPPDIPLALEVPTASLAQHMPASERVRMAVTATRRVLANVGR